jgi:hypothetical protein
VAVEAVLVVVDPEIREAALRGVEEAAVAAEPIMMQGCQKGC